MDEKFNRRFTSFCNSLDALSEAKNRDFSDSFVLSGTSAKFSITFDLAWKVMKDILVQYYAITGFVTGSPREVLREAFKANLISDEAWMEMLKGGRLKPFYHISIPVDLDFILASAIIRKIFLRIKL